MPGWTDPYATDSAVNTDDVSGGDYWKTLKSGTEEIGSSLGALPRVAGEKVGGPVGKGVSTIGAYFQDLLGDLAEQNTKEMSPAAQKRLSSTITSSDFWEHPFSAGALKTTKMSPAVLAALIPGDAVVAAMIGGTMNAAGTVDQIYKQTDALDDAALQKQSAQYKTLRTMMDEGEARAEFNHELMGAKPAIDFLFGTAAGLVGPAAAITRGVKGEAAALGAGRSGVLGRTAIGATEAGVGGGAQAGVQNYNVQSAAVEGGLKQGIDVGELVDQALEGTALTAVMGGATGAAFKGHVGKEASPDNGKAPELQPEQVGPTPKGASSGTPVQPATTVNVGDPQNAPTRSDTQYPKAEKAKSAGKGKKAKATDESTPPDVTTEQKIALDTATRTPTNDIVEKVVQSVKEATPEVTPKVTPEVAPEPSITDPVPQPKEPSITDPVPQPVRAAPDSTPVEASPQADIQPSITDPVPQPAPGKGRVLEDLTPENQVARTRYRQEDVENRELQAEQEKAFKKAKRQGEEGYEGKHRSKDEVAAREAQAAKAKEIFDSVPDDLKFPTSAKERAALRDQVETIIKTARDAGIEIPIKVTDATPDHLAWLRDAADFLKSKEPKQAQVQEFLVRTKAAKSGDFSVLREGRREQGEEKSRVYQGDVEKIAVNKEGPPAELGQPQGEAVPKAAFTEAQDADRGSQPKSSGKGPPRGISDGRVEVKSGSRTVEKQAASAVRKVEITPEMKAKALAALETAKNRSGRSEELAKAKLVEEPGEAPKVVLPKKAEAVVAKAKAVGKAKLTEEAKKVERAPSDAQRDAENHAMGHVRLEGLDVTIKTAKGAERSGVTPEGKRWTNIAPDHIGHIRRTVGADGENVDIFLGPKAHPGNKQLKDLPVIVIDQIHPDSREFDEHKVMFGYDDVRHAIGAYDKAFSDGRGMERVGDITPMTLDEFKQWLKRGDTTEALKHDEPRPAFQDQLPGNVGHAEIKRVSEHIDALEKRIIKLQDEHPDPYGPEWMNITEVRGKMGYLRQVLGDARDALEIAPEYPGGIAPGGIDLAELAASRLQLAKDTIAGFDQLNLPAEAKHSLQDLHGPVAKEPVRGLVTRQEIQPQFSSKFRDVLPSLNLTDIAPVPAQIAQFVSRRLNEVSGDTPIHVVTGDDMSRLTGDGHAAWGLHEMDLDGTDGRVYIHADRLTEPGATTHTVLHEVTHNATVRSLYDDPVYRKNIRDIMDVVRSHLAELNIRGDIEAFFQHDTLEYALRNEREFVAEAFSNPKVQEILGKIVVPEELAKQVGLVGPRKWSVWDVFVEQVRRMLNLPKGTYSLLEATIKASERGFELKKNANRAEHEFQTWMAAQQDALRDSVLKPVHDLFKRPDVQEQMGKPWLLKIRTLDNIAQTAERYFGGNVVRRIADTIERVRVGAERRLKESEPIVTKLYELEKKYKDTGDWQKFTELVYDETTFGVHADVDLTHTKNKHVGKNSLAGIQARAKHPELAERYRALPADLKEARAEAMKFFTDKQNEMTLGLINNRVLKLMGIKDDALATRIHEDTLSEADVARIDAAGGEGAADLIQSATELSKVKGPYFPLMRRGDHVVIGHYKLAEPTGAKHPVRKLSDNEWEFSNRDEAERYAAAQDTRTSVKSVWVDSTTGDTHGTEDGKRYKITPKDSNAEQRFRVQVQDRHVEFFDSARKALEAAAQLEKEGTLRDKPSVQERKFEPGDRKTDMMSTQLKTLAANIENRNNFKSLDPHSQHMLRRALDQAAIQFLGSTRIQSRRLPRTYVEGASKDFTRNTWDYAQSVSGYLSKLEHQPALEADMKSMREQVTGDYAHSMTLGRSAIANEIEKRVWGDNGFIENDKFSPVTKRLMTMSFLDKLASPAYSVINALQPTMVTMPVLGGRHGYGRAFAEMTKAYNDIGGLSVTKEGFRNTARKARDASAEASDLIGDIKARLENPKEREMIDYLIERGSIDPDAGLEIKQLVKAKSGVGGKIDTGLGYLEGIARQMPKAIEAINRSVTALAAYRLEMKRFGDHDRAMRYAQETTNNTQFLYSNTNSAPVFNHPLAKLTLQFKKFGQGMYTLLGEQVAKAVKNQAPGDRAEALKTLAGIVATHAAFAGALGLPTEPFKYLLMGLQAAGITSTGWNDVENKFREGAASVFGKTGGEVVSRGLPRLAGIDLSTRVGLDSLMSFGEPKSNKDTDVKSWMFDTLAGAPVALVGDYIKGANQLTSGNFEKAAELMIPVKVIADSLRAYRQATEGKKSATGRDTMSPYTPVEAAVRAAGFTPQREAEDSARRGAFFGQQKSQGSERQDLMSKWVTAKPQDKAGAWKNIQLWNAQRPADARISMSDLTSSARRRETEERSGTVTQGIRSTKRDKYLLDNANRAYNP